jgi:hypothetical protein
MSARRSFEIHKAREALGVLEDFALKGQQRESPPGREVTWGEAMNAIGAVDELLRTMLAESDRRTAAHSRKP